jgi:hypothetical protein
MFELFGILLEFFVDGLPKHLFLVADGRGHVWPADISAERPER